MNCTRCGMSLEPNARFCRNCGLTVPVAAPDNAANQGQLYQPTVPVAPLQTAQSQSQQPQPLSYQPTQPVMPPANVQGAAFPATGSARPRRGRRMRGCLVTLLVLILLVGVGWIFALRPYVHTVAQDQIDQVLSNVVNQIPPPVALLPPGTVRVREIAINNLIVLNTAPSDPVQQAQMHISPGGVRLDFLAYGIPGAVTGVPQVINGPLNGQLVITNVTVEGIAALVMSPDEMTSLINRHLADAQTRFNHSITSISLQDHELDMVVGPPIQPGPSLP